MPNKIEIIFLGTSAQIPTAKRNHTAILLTYNGENILVDCGEGTQRQFRKAKLNLGKITKILITHIHGDHVYGLPGLIATLEQSGYSKELNIYGPRGIKRFLSEFIGLERRNFKINVKEVSGKFCEEKDFYIESDSMSHGIPCNAYSFVIKDKIRIDKGKLHKFKIPIGKHLSELQKGKDMVINGKKYLAKNLTYGEKGKKISFVLDTGMNKKIAPFVKNSDLLICEASFSSEHEKQAEEHLHLTAFQDGKIAKASGSKKLILTHISSRYENDIKKLLDDARENFKNVAVANDFDKFEV